jgi:F0F1-type ATP synthase assembly protein I
MRLKSALIHVGNRVFSIIIVFAIGFAVGNEIALKYPTKPWALWVALAVLFCACGKMLVRSCKHAKETQQQKQQEQSRSV